MGNLNWLDISVIVLFFLIIAGMTIFYSGKAGKNIQNFFLSGRNLPWYVAGTAMVATTFAADTPLAVTELVAMNGVAGNWIWWNMAIGGMLTVFFFAKLWRRAGVLTDLEFIEIRYSGIGAAILRGFRSIYLGLFMNIIIIAWVHKAMEKIFLVTLPEFDPFLLVTILALVIGIYASASGLLGSARIDSFQFAFALAGCIILAFLVVKIPQIGSMANLKEMLPLSTIEFFPRVSGISAGGLGNGVLSLSLGAFIAYVGVQWWASWYPGADPGGGGYIAQRMMSAKDEKHSLLATLWFNIAHYTLRPWPWIIVALAALVLLPRSESTEVLQDANPYYFDMAESFHNQGGIRAMPADIKEDVDFLHFYENYENTIDPGVMYPKLMVQYLPAGLLGLLIALFMAAYMSTISAQLNWGTSYIVNDFYKRFYKREATDKHYVFISRLSILIMLVLSLILTKYVLTTISGAWMFIINASAGIGTVLILRWYWWRVNAWSEIAAMAAPLLIYPVTNKIFSLEFPLSILPVVALSSIIWIAVTFITKPVDSKVLNSFYQRVYPGGIGWRKISANFKDLPKSENFGKLFVNWILGIIAIYVTMYGVGKILFAEYVAGLISLIVVIGVTIVLYINIRDKTASSR